MLACGESVRRHPLVSAAVMALGTSIAVRGFIMHAGFQLCAYGLAVGAGAVVIDVIEARWGATPRTVPVRQSTLEVAGGAAIFVVAFVWLWMRFVAGYRPEPGPMRLAWLVLLVGCVFDLFLVIWLLARRYSLGDLGLRLSGLTAASAVFLIFAASSRLLSPSSLTWSAAVSESGGSWLALLATALSAAAPEEFFRFFWQTRLGAALRNPAVAWLVTAALWASLHAPVDWSQSHDAGSTIMGVVNIVPLGLLWGYLIRRTQSLIPSFLLHATNLWGLQNLP